MEMFLYPKQKYTNISGAVTSVDEVETSVHVIMSKFSSTQLLLWGWLTHSAGEEKKCMAQSLAGHCTAFPRGIGLMPALLGLVTTCNCVKGSDVS